MQTIKLKLVILELALLLRMVVMKYNQQLVQIISSLLKFAVELEFIKENSQIYGH